MQKPLGLVAVQRNPRNSRFATGAQVTLSDVSNIHAIALIICREYAGSATHRINPIGGSEWKISRFAFFILLDGSVIKKKKFIRWI